MSGVQAELPAHEAVPALDAIGVRAFVTTRDAGDFAIPADVSPGTQPAGDTGADQSNGGSGGTATSRWRSLLRSVGALGAPRLASARQVHGTQVLVHGDEWEGWMVAVGADAHLLTMAGAAAITVADCVPVFIAHPAGAAAVVHAGWRGVADGILGKAVRAFVDRGLRAEELVVHLGPSICGRCYEVGPDVYERLTGWSTQRPRQVDLRALLSEQAKELGVTKRSVSGECTRCDNDRFFSHRAGDAGRQVACIVAPG